ncbi:MAG TPA: amino acid adenylation domain-containing protein, partial [Pyrinomonadaceae bacterium]|nr:amino acid adenylation domain-containing protein [Pyrinomonadaceae bacterium]
MEKERPDNKNHSERVGGLTPEKQELIELLLQEDGGEPDVFPLSFAQERLWFLQQLEPDSAAYNIAGAMRLQGQLNVSALESAINEIVRRHEVLRTTFSLVDGRPMQVIAQFRTVPLPVIDLSGTPEAERAAEVERLTTREARLPFDFEKGPLVRATLVRLQDDEHALLFTMHHIVSDGWSLGVLVAEVGALYEAYTNGRPSPLPELEIQYADFAVWQREWLRGKVLEDQLSYWKSQLGGSPPVLQLPTDHPRPASGISRGEKVPLRLSATQLRMLKQLSNREGVTLFMTLLAAFQVLLSRYSGQEDIVVGTPIAGRNRAEVEGLIGFFVNTLAMRADLSGDPTFAELLGRVRESALGAYAHQDVPFEKLVEELQPARHLGHSPLFQVMFIFQNTPARSAQLSGLSVNALPVETQSAKFDLTLELREDGGALTGELEYSVELFERGTAERLARAYERLLGEVADKPRAKLSEALAVKGEERRRLLVEWNDTEADYASDVCIHELFEQQAQRTPSAAAVAFGDVTLTYRELDERANRLAQHLRSLGVGRESLVGVLLERNEQMVVSVLAVLKAGGAYVPLDPAYPQERLRFTLEDARAGVLITQESLLTRESLADLLGAAALSVVRVDADSEQIAAHPDTPPASGVTAENLAYVIYTSGSTGRPKGVAIAHRSAAALVSWALSVYDAGQLRGVLAATSLSFDLSVFELFVTLASGGCVLVADSALSLAAVATRHKVTLVNTVPSAMAELLRAGDVPGGLEVVNLAGEPLTRALAEGTYAAGAARVYNLYGPTEDTTYSTWELVNRGCEPTIGRPISNTRAYVLDARMSLVPVGVAGELYLGGDGLARGYLNRPDLTAERFVPDPFAHTPGGRLYRTGDVVRYLPDGRMEFMGRADHQVKVRGFRIELGEVESALAEHEAVRECVVVAREFEGGDKRLVAYVVAEEKGEGALAAELSAAELRAHLKGRLPEYMVPTAFVTLDAMPLTPNGKVDRKALPKPSEGTMRVEYVGARTPVEGVLAGVWSRLLGLEKVGVNENFFELGGHSLLATQLVSGVREALGVDLPLRAVFESPTVAELATRVKREIGAGTASPAAIVRAPRDEALPLSFAQERLWFLDRLEPGSALYNMPAALRLRGALDVDALSMTLDEVVRRHESLRTTFPVIEGRPAQAISDAARLQLRLDDLSHLEGAAREARVRELTAEEAARPFDLARGPLVRASLLRLAEDEHVLLWTMHHIVSDGWSLGVLVAEVGALYEAYSNGRPSPLPELEIQYADFAVWQRGWLQGEVLEGHLDYWRKQLAGAPPVLELPTDHSRPSVQTFRGARNAFKLPPELTAQLRALSQREGVTLFMTLLAAFQVLLSRYSGQDDVVVGTPIAGRNRAEVEGLIGFFVNTLAMRADLSGDPTFVELLGRVRESALGAYAHQDVPFEKLVEELQPARHLGHSPLFQVMFIFQNTPASTASLSGLHLSALPIETLTAKFDLTLELREEREQLIGELEYSTELFEQETIEKLARAYEELLGEMAGRPRAKLSEALTVKGEERRRLLVEWNDTHTDYAHDKCIHELFEEQTARTPDAVALMFGEEQVTFAELNGRANKLAHHLRGRGVGPEVRVGVSVERSIEMVVALFAVHKAGGAYVPLDPNYPQERIAFMLEDARPSVLLTQERLAERLPAYAGKVVRLDTDWERIESESDENPTPSAVSENLAYVIYTSGSTGRPKGVLGIHRACINRFEWMWERDPFGRDEICCQKTSLSFVDSIWEIFGPLLQGVPLVIIPDELVKDPPRLVEVLAERAVTRIVLVPSLLRALLDAGAGARLPRLRHWVSSGEALGPDLVERFKSQGDERGGGDTSRTRRLLNLYGSSEVCADATCYETPPQLEGRSVPIGRPIANTEVFILDRHLQLVPVGVAGEIYVGGEGLSRGYLERPDLTAERFVPNPHANAPGARLYRTGDLGRHLPTGDIEYLGRADHQVKVRGVRVELGEVETVLGEHPSVEACVVLLRESAGDGDAQADARLVAYVTGGGSREVGAAELRAYARERLPEHMVPSHFVTLDALPLTPNGKVDRRALLALDLSGAAADVYVAPRTPVEELVAGVWAEVLGVLRVGVEEDFFDAGGHSLLATQLVTRLREAFGVEVPLRSFFGAPTVEGVAAFIERALGEGVEGRQPQIERVSRDEPLPLSFAQERLWFLHQLDPDSPAYNILIPMRIKGRLDVGLMKQSFAEVLRRHEIYRTTYHLVEGRPVQVVHPPQGFDWPLVDLTELPEEERESEAGRLIVEEGKRPFDLEHGPMWRVLLVRLGEEEHVLVLTEHHMVHDGWTEGTLVRDFLRFYAAHSAGEQPPLAELPIQYADFAAWQRRHFQGETLEQSLAFWKERLGDLPPVL